VEGAVTVITSFLVIHLSQLPEWIQESRLQALVMESLLRRFGTYLKCTTLDGICGENSRTGLLPFHLLTIPFGF
jgi:hypothetical protein